MRYIFLQIQQAFDLTDEEIWLLTGVPFSGDRKGFDILNKCKEFNIFGDKKEYITWSRKNEALEDLENKGLLVSRTEATSIHLGGRNVEKFFAISPKVLSGLTPVCPVGRIERQSHEYHNRQPFT